MSVPKHDWDSVDWSRTNAAIAESLGATAATVRARRWRMGMRAFQADVNPRPIPLATFPSLPQARAKATIAAARAGAITWSEAHERIRGMRRT